MKKLCDLCKEMDVSMYSLAILDNHVHFLLQTQEKNKEKEFIRRFAGGTAREINQLNGKTGTFWNRYFAWLITDETAYYNVSAYILGNPLRHGLVKDFDELYDYPYSDFRKYCELHGREAVEEKILAVLKIKNTKNEDEFFEWLNIRRKVEIPE